MKTEILRKQEVVKEKHISERPPLPKVRKDQHVCGAIEAAHKAIKEIKEEINKSLAITDINQIEYAMASTITEQIGIEEIQKGRLQKKGDTSLERKKIEWDIQRQQRDLSILSEMQKGSKLRREKLSKLINFIKVKNDVDMVTAKELLKQQIQAKAWNVKKSSDPCVILVIFTSFTNVVTASGNTVLYIFNISLHVLHLSSLIHIFFMFFMLSRVSCVCVWHDYVSPVLAEWFCVVFGCL